MVCVEPKYRKFVINKVEFTRMDTNHQATNGKSNLGEAYIRQDEAEIELALQVQHAEPGDAGLLALLTERYFGEVFRLAQILLTHAGGKLPTESDVLQVILQTFTFVSLHPHRFHGKISLRNWLLRITIRQALKARRVKGRSPATVTQEDTAPVSDENREGFWTRFDHLSEKQRLILSLRYACNMQVADLADMLQMRLKNAHTILITARHELMGGVPAAHRADQLDAYLDALLAAEPFARDELESHLQKCHECEAYLAHMRAFEKQLRQETQQRWPALSWTSHEVEQFVKNVVAQLPERRARRVRRTSVRKVASAASILLLFAVLVYLSVTQVARQAEIPPQSSVTPTLPLKVVLPQQPDQEAGSNESSTGPVSSVNLYTYDLSDNAQVLAFIHMGYDVNSQQEDTAQQVLLYDKQTNEKIEIRYSQNELGLMDWLNSPPSLSIDGRYLAYSAYPPVSDDQQQTCRTPDGQPCADIYIYDRMTATTQQITQGVNGEPANGGSLAPRISGDGRWVAFWSMASNLSEDDSLPCSVNDPELQPCMDIFLTDLQEGSVTRKPVGTIPPGESITPDRISLSADGSLIAFTVGAQDQLGEKLGIQHESQAVLYDRQSNAYRLLNQTADGTPGNAASYSPVVSADGRYVAFSSLASNLVEGDTNGVADVFLLDLQEGALERVSLGPQGEQGIGDSGLLMDGVGFNSVDISADGRYIIFTSLATNFGPEVECNPDLAPCNLLLLYDRLSATTEVIQPIRDSTFYLMPQVSNDGQWVSYMEFRLNCGITQGLCMETILFDRQRGWYQDMVEALFEPVQKAWQEDELIELTDKEVELITVSKNGNLLAASSNDETIGIWDFKQEKWVKQLSLQSNSPISSLAITLDGTTLAAGTVDGHVHIWELPTGKYLYVLADHPGRVHSVQFSSDGKELFVGTPREVWVWRRNGQEINRAYRLSYDSAISTIALGPSDNLLAAAGLEKTIWLQLLPSGTVLTSLNGGTSAIIDVTFSPDGRRLAARTMSGTIQAWEVDWQGFGALQTEFAAEYENSALFGDLAFSPDGKYLISGSMYQGVMLWDIENNDLASLYSTERGDAVIKSTAFSPNGLTILAGVFGGIDTWSSANIKTNPVYFQPYGQAEFNHLVSQGYVSKGYLHMEDWSQSLGSPIDSETPLTLYEADKLRPFDLLVPTHLPEQVQFTGAEFLLGEGIALRYEVGLAEGVVADLYVYETPLISTTLTTPVGAESLVEDVKIEDIEAEYVQGAWVIPQGESETGLWTWDNAQPVQRLRWNTSDLSIEVFYREQPGVSRPDLAESLNPSSPGVIKQHNLSLDMDDLLQIAGGMERLPDYTSSDTMRLSYVVREGDTCSGIATWFGTTTQVIAKLNGLPEDCSVIYAGQPMLVQLSRQRADVGRIDLDCDGVEERLQLAPVSDTSSQAGAYGISLQTMSDMGIYQDAWQITVAGEGADTLTAPQIITFGDCVNLIAFQVVKDGQPQLRIYQWVNGQMQLLLDQGVEVVAVRRELYWLEVHEHVIDPVSGACQVWRVSYEWHSRKLIEMRRRFYYGRC